MAFCIVTSTTNSITINFGDYSLLNVQTGILPYERILGKTDIVLDRRENDITEAHIEFNKQKFRFSFSGDSGTLRVEKVDETAVTSNLHLFQLLKELIS